MGDVHQLVQAAVAAHLAALDADWEERQRLEQMPSRGRRRVPGQSLVYSIRLDPDEVAALESRALRLGLKPSVLGRNLIRAGLSRKADEQLSEVVERLEALTEELRSLVP